MVFFDCETTGLKAIHDRIVEVCIVVVNDALEVVDKFVTLINPGVSMPADVSKINGITDSMLAAAPSFTAVADKIYQLLNSQVVVGQYPIFDIEFLAEEFKRIGYPVPAYKTVLDTRQMAKRVLRLEKYSLVNIARELGISDEQDHRAESDVLMTLAVYKRLR